MCKDDGGPIDLTAPGWNGWGNTVENTRYQANPGVKPDDVPKLKVKWSFSMAGGGQPTVVGNWLFVTNRSGKFYALDTKTGCVHWVISDLVSRHTPPVVKSSISPSGWSQFMVSLMGHLPTLADQLPCEAGHAILISTGHCVRRGFENLPDLGERHLFPDFEDDDFGLCGRQRA